jgi:hypothetical protein
MKLMREHLGRWLESACYDLRYLGERGASNGYALTVLRIIRPEAVIYGRQIGSIISRLEDIAGLSEEFGAEGRNWAVAIRTECDYLLHLEKIGLNEHLKELAECRERLWDIHLRIEGRSVPFPVAQDHQVYCQDGPALARRLITVLREQIAAFQALREILRLCDSPPNNPSTNDAPCRAITNGYHTVRGR